MHVEYSHRMTKPSQPQLVRKHQTQVQTRSNTKKPKLKGAIGLVALTTLKVAFDQAHKRILGRAGDTRKAVVELHSPRLQQRACISNTIASCILFDLYAQERTMQTMRSWQLWGLGVMVLAAMPAWSKRAITHEDLWLMPRVGAAVVSPDGMQMVVPVTAPAYDPLKQSVDLWLAPVDGSTSPRQLTHTLAAETTPVWSPDGTRLAFSTLRGDDLLPQIYILDLAKGGEARRVSESATGARNPQFSPDGRGILFLSNVDVTPPEQAQAKGLSTARIYDNFPIRFWDKWLAPSQLRIFYRTLDDSPNRGAARDLLAGSALVSSPGYGGRTGEATDELDAIFSPDGASVLFVASQNRHLGAKQFTHADLYQVQLKGGEARRLTGPGGTEPSDSYSRPRFTPDGKRLLALVETRTEKVYSAPRLARFTAPDWRAQGVISGPESLAIGSFDVGADSKTVYFLAEQAGQDRLWQVAVTGGKAKLLSTSKQGVYTNLSSANQSRKPVVLAGFESAVSPSEVVRFALNPGPEMGSHRALSAFSRTQAADLDLPAIEHFWHESDGRKIHSMLVKPAGFDPSRKYPLFVLIHGGPHIMWRDQFFLRWNYHLLAGEDRVLLLTNYRGSTGFGERFAQAIQGDPLQGPADDVNSAADAALKRYAFIDSARQCAGGASYGGHLANWLQVSTTRYRCLVSHAGLINLESQWATSDIVYPREVNMGGPVWEGAPVWQQQNPIRLVPKFNTPVLVSFGELDYRVPINNGIEYWSMLKRQNVPSRLIVFPDENHWILKGENSRFFYREVDAWLQRWLSPY